MRNIWHSQLAIIAVLKNFSKMALFFSRFFVFCLSIPSNLARGKKIEIIESFFLHNQAAFNP